MAIPIPTIPISIKFPLEVSGLPKVENMQIYSTFCNYDKIIFQ